MLNVKLAEPEVEPASLNCIDLSGPAGADVAVIPVKPLPSPTYEPEKDPEREVATTEPVTDTMFVALSNVKFAEPEVVPVSLNYTDLFEPAELTANKFVVAPLLQAVKSIYAPLALPPCSKILSLF